MPSISKSRFPQTASLEDFRGSSIFANPDVTRADFMATILWLDRTLDWMTDIRYRPAGACNQRISENSLFARKKL